MFGLQPRILLVCISAGLVVAPTCSARIITVKITAEVTNVEVWGDGPPDDMDDIRFMAESFRVGDRVEGVYAYDTSAPDGDVDDHRGGYGSGTRPFGIAVSTNQFVFKTDPENVSLAISVANDSPHIAPRDRFTIQSHDNLMIPQVGNLRCRAISLDLRVLAYPGPLGDDSLPDVAPILEKWDIRTLEFGAYIGGRGPSVYIAAVLMSAELLPDPAWVLYVDAAAAAAGDGSSWRTAYASLQDALANVPTVGNTVIRVAQGTYRPDQGAGITPGDRTATFQLVNGVSIRGGYAGVGGPDPNARDVDLYESILSGDLGPISYSRSRPGTYTPMRVRSRTVVTGSATDRTAVLDGFTVTGGHYSAPVPRIIPGHPPSPTGYGGGMNNLAGSPTVIGCTFVDNTTEGAGAGMCNEAASHPRIMACSFIGNFAHAGGGAVANLGGSNPTIAECTFTENSAWGKGGGMYNRESGPILERCTFTYNSTRPQYGAYGGAIYNTESTCTLRDCRLEWNAASHGGAICNWDGTTLILERCAFVGNSASLGGAMIERTRDNSSSVLVCTFTQNSASGSAGALSLAGPAFVSDCTFSGNTSRLLGGAAHVRTGTFANCLFVGNRACEDSPVQQSTAIPGMGGAVYTGGSIEPLSFVNCTFAANRAAWGSAVSTDKFTEFRNCILRGPTPLIRTDPWEAQPVVAFSNVEGGWPGEANIDVAPLFAEPGHWADPNDPNRPGDPNDPNTVWTDGDYHLKSQAGRWDPNSDSWVKDDATSPCIDAGDPNSPIGLEPFPNGGRINMGAYGGTAEASKSYFGEPVCETVIAGDINGDCRVDFRDLQIMASHWLEERGD